MLHGLAYFPGVQSLVGCTYSLTHGITPSAAVLTITPQQSTLSEGGTLEIGDGSGSVSFPDCKIDKGSLRWDTSGQYWEVVIYDRRWKWVAGPGRIGGTYNLWGPDKLSLKTSTKKNPQELARLLLEAAGESGYDVTGLPTEGNPEVHWEDANPWQELATLCDRFGCRVVLGLDNRVHLVQVGQGGSLPGGGIISYGATLDPPEVPDKLEISCGPTLWQQDWPLEAVGIEADEDQTVKLIDDLSYKPDGGWGGSHPPYFDNVEGSFTTEAGETVYHRELAAQSVFRMYRIKFPLEVQGYNGDQPESLEYIVVTPSQVDKKTEDQNGVDVEVPKPAEVHGKWITRLETYQNQDDELVKRTFSIDTEKGIVEFAEPIFANSDDGEANNTLDPTEPTLYLRTAFQIRDKTTRALDRYRKEKQLGNFGTKARVDRHEELQLSRKDGEVQNQESVDAACTHYLDGLEREYQATQPETVKYVGILPIDVDGAIQQVTWTVGTQGASTVASRNDEQLVRTPSYEERRMRDVLREARRHWGVSL